MIDFQPNRPPPNITLHASVPHTDQSVYQGEHHKPSAPLLSEISKHNDDLPRGAGRFVHYWRDRSGEEELGQHGMSSQSGTRDDFRPMKGHDQRCKLCRKLGRSFPVGLGTSSRILRGSPAVFVLSRNFAVNCAFFGLFWVNFADFQHFWVDFGHFWANFEHFLTAFISRFLENGSASQ